MRWESTKKQKRRVSFEARRLKIVGSAYAKTNFTSRSMSGRT
jgi:hypothetical protein